MRNGFAFPSHGFPVFSVADAAELQQQLGAAGEVTMQASGRAIVTSASASPHAAGVTGALANFLVFGHKNLYAGRFFTDAEAARNASVVVISYLLAREFSANGDLVVMLDHVVRVHGRPMTVVGVMPPYTGERGFQAIVPVRAAAGVFGSQEPVTPMLVVRAPAIELVTATQERVEEWLATRYRNWRAQVTVASSLAQLEQVQSAMLLFRFMMGALAGISLVVGGVGIMNVLLASVTERTRGIGVRKALGARRRDILYQFLTESVAIAGLGSGVGSCVGLTAAFVVADVVRWRVPGAPLYAAVTFGTLATSILLAVVIGLTFWTVPALRASRLSPIDAIRQE